MRQILLAVFPILMLTACAGSGSAPMRRELPATSSIVPAPYPLPSVRSGDDALVALAQNRAAAAENARRLATASRNYEALRRDYEGTR